MTPLKAYLKLTAPEGMGALCASGKKKLNVEKSRSLLEQLSAEDWAEFIRTTLSMAGDNVPEAARAEEEWFIDVFLNGDGPSVDLLTFQFQTALNNIVKESQQDFADTYQDDSDCFYLEYDPVEWFTNKHPYGPGHKSYTHFLSGRLFAMAWTGLLDAYGFTVEGTELEEEPEA
jgi:hypothetical protein